VPLALPMRRSPQAGSNAMGNRGAYVVEVLGHGDDLVYLMDEVKQWRQDSFVYAPRTEFHWASEILVFRVTFNTWTEATSFARSFDGRLLGAQAAE
jgi:hypothetical protein